MQPSLASAPATIRPGLARTAPPARPALPAPPAPPGDETDAVARVVIFHPLPRQGLATVAAAPSFLSSRESSAVARDDAAEPAPSLRERARRHCCRSTLALATGLFLGGCIGGLTAFGLQLDGYDSQAVATRSLIAGGVSAAAIAAISWWLLDEVIEHCANGQDETD